MEIKLHPVFYLWIRYTGKKNLFITIWIFNWKHLFELKNYFSKKL